MINTQRFFTNYFKQPIAVLWAFLIPFACPFAWLLVDPASSSGGTPETAILVSADSPPYLQAVEGFTRQVSSISTATIYQMKGDTAQGREMGKRIRASGAQVVLAVGLKAALVAKLEIIDIPVVFCLVLNPADYGLPSPNMIGIRLRVPSDEQLETIRSLVPSVQKIGLVYDPDFSATFVSHAHNHAQDLGLSLLGRPISSSTDLPDTLRALLPQIDVLWLIRDPTVITEASIPFILETALETRRPVFGFSAGMAQHGAMAAVSVNYYEIGNQAGTLAQTILNHEGLSASFPSLVVPSHTRLALNLGTSQFLGVTHTSQTIQLASEVFGGAGAFAQRSASAPSVLSEDQIPNSLLLP